MDLFFSVLADIIHFAKVIIVCNMFIGLQKRNEKSSKVSMIFANIAIIITSNIIYTLDNYAIEVLLYFVVIFMLIYFLYIGKLYQIFLLTTGIVLILSMIDTMTIALVNLVAKLLLLNWSDVYELIATVISISLIMALGILYKKNKTIRSQQLGVFSMLGIIILLTVDTFVVSAMTIGIGFYEGLSKKVYLSAVILVILGIFIQLAAVIILFAQRNIHKEKEQISNAYLNQQKNHYEYLENREKETKKFRHDLRSHMELISSLVKKHDYEQIEDYIKQMNLKIDTFGNIVTVQNGIVDAIINQYYTKSEQCGIKMEVKGMFPVDCAIETFDLCTIFSNALNNAYEATIDADEKYISLECGYTDKNIIVIVRNTFNIELADNDLGQKTTKKNKDLHGFGLENIKDSVAKYNGYFDIEKNDNIFILKIMFNYVGK